MGWLFDPEKTDQERWAPDLLKTRDLGDKPPVPLFVILSFTPAPLIGLSADRHVPRLWTAFRLGQPRPAFRPSPL